MRPEINDNLYTYNLRVGCVRCVYKSMIGLMDRHGQTFLRLLALVSISARPRLIRLATSTSADITFLY